MLKANFTKVIAGGRVLPGAAARRRAELRLDAGGIEQQRALLSLRNQALIEIFRPMVEDRHGADQRDRWIAPPQSPYAVIFTQS